MSFNNHLAFSVLKATPTTSTTNTNTTSQAASPPKLDAGTPKLSALKDSNLPLLQNMFSASSANSSPKIGAVSATSSIVTPATASVNELSGPKDKQDLLGLLGKYDVDKRGSDAAEDVDLIEEKMKQFTTEAALVESTTTHVEKEVGADTSCASSTKDVIVEEKPPMVQTVDDPTDSEVQQQQSPTQLLSSVPVQNAMSMQPYVFPEESEIKAETLSNSRVETPLDSQTGDLLDVENSEPIQEFPVSEFPQNTATLVDVDAPVRPRPHRNDSIARVTQSTVNPREQYQQSHKAFDFQTFLNHLKKKSADPIVRYIRSFLVSFSKQANGLSAPQMIKAINQFKDFINQKFQDYEPFASMDATDLENSGEGVEKLIMNRLYDYCFSPEAVRKFGGNASPSMQQDVRDDYEFSLQVAKFSWILGIHLDVDLDELSRKKSQSSKENIDYMEYAIREVNKINNYRAPRDKIICILNSCKIIFSLLKVSNQETNADAFIPLLILVIIKAKTDNIISNLHYIERFRGEEWLNHGETSYYLSSVQGVITFIQNIKLEDLTIDQKEFDANMEAWEADLRQRPVPLIQTQPLHVDDAERQHRQTMSPSNVILASAEMFGKSISNFISPSPHSPAPPSAPSDAPAQEDPKEIEARVDESFNQLSEVFPTLDKAIMRDILIMNKGDMEQSLETFLQLVNDN